MSSLIASRINSSDIILEFQIPVLPHRIAITRFGPVRLIITEQTRCPGNYDFTLNDGQRSQQYWAGMIQKLDQNSNNLETGFSCSQLTSEAALGPCVITSLDVCPLLVSPRNCLAQLAPVSQSRGTEIVADRGCRGGDSGDPGTTGG